VRDLVGHATGTATKMVTLVEGEMVYGGPSTPADWVCEDPVARLRELAERLGDALPGTDFDAPRPSPLGEAPLHQGPDRCIRWAARSTAPRRRTDSATRAVACSKRISIATVFGERPTFG
jgi:hypothetical protein